MYSVKKNKITLTRGDTFISNVIVKRKDEIYTPIEGDVIRFAVKHQTMTPDQTEYTDSEPLLVKEIPVDTLILRLDPEDTKGLGFDTYDSDVEITKEDGTVDTFISSTITLTKEVD